MIDKVFALLFGLNHFFKEYFNLKIIKKEFNNMMTIMK
jgi:hypothetical protein